MSNLTGWSCAGPRRGLWPGGSQVWALHARELHQLLPQVRQAQRSLRLLTLMCLCRVAGAAPWKSQHGKGHGLRPRAFSRLVRSWYLVSPLAWIGAVVPVIFACKVEEGSERSAGGVISMSTSSSRCGSTTDLLSCAGRASVYSGACSVISVQLCGLRRGSWYVVDQGSCALRRFAAGPLML